MVLFTRCVTVLTVLLALALMAVSAYAARMGLILSMKMSSSYC